MKSKCRAQVLRALGIRADVFGGLKRWDEGR